MTLAELQGHLGLSSRGPARGAYFAVRGDRYITAWTDVMRGESGWWWVITTGPLAMTDSIVAMGWSGGNTRDRDMDIAIAIACPHPRDEAGVAS